MSPQRSFRLGEKQVVIEGVSDSDPYFRAMGDGVEDNFFNFCRKYLRPNDVALDIGANIGITSTILSQCLPDGHIYVFEPADTVFSVLRRNVQTNKLINVSTSNLAMSDKVGTAYFKDQSAYGHLVSGEGSGHKVETSTIDAFSQNLAAVDFIKIDVEGFEQSVLSGGTETIANYSPLIYMEFNSWCLITQSRTNPLDFMEWILANFSHVYAADKTDPRLVRNMEKDGAVNFLHRNMTDSGFVDDLVMTNDPSRLQDRSSSASIAP